MFGCTVHYMFQKRNRRHGVKSQQNLFVGYCEHLKTYRLIDMSTNKALKSGNVIFDGRKMMTTYHTSIPEE